MKRKLLSVALLCILGVGAVSGCAESGYSVEINNKEEIESEWHMKDSYRQLDVTITYEDEIQNPTSAISSGELTISSSDTSVVTTGGLNIYAAGEGSATITAEYHGHKDTVDVTVLPEAEGSHSWALGGTYFLAIESDGTTYYFTGYEVSGYSYEGELTTSPTGAVPVTITAGSELNSYYMSYELDGTTYYITIMDTGSHINVQFVTEAALIYWDADNGVFCNDSKNYFLCYNSTYNCLYASSYSDWLGSAPVAELIDVVEGKLPEPVEWVAGYKYALGYEKNNSVYYYNGKVQMSFYGDVSTSVDDAVAVLVEECGSGYSLKLDNGKYLGFGVSSNDSGVHYNFTWDNETAYEWGYDEELDTFTATYEEKTYVMGTTSSYNEITMVEPEGNYIAHLYELSSNYSEPSAPTSITLSSPVTSIYVGMKTVVTSSVTGDQYVSDAVTWSISSTYGATIENGTVTSGTAAETITVTAASTLDPTVISDPLSIIISAVPSDCVGILGFGAVTETGGTQIKESSDLDDCWVGTSSVFTGLTDIDSENAPVYRGTGSGGTFPNTAGAIKFGKSNYGGKLTFNFASGTTIKSATICAHGWYTGGNNSGDTADKLTVGSESLELSYSGTPTEVTWSDSTGVSSLTLSTDSAQSKRCYIFYIVLYSTEQAVSTSIA